MFGKALLEHLLDALAVRVARANHALTTHPKRRLQEITTDESVDYIRTHARGSVLVDTQKDLLRIALGEVKTEGLYLEFGVNRGESIRFIAAKTTSPVHGFDSFVGLPEHGAGTGWTKGQFDQKGQLPAVPANVILHKGWFNETLPAFLGQHRDAAAFVHIDCDLYTSTKIVLELIGERVVAGTIIVFDEYLNVLGWREHEFKAFQEFVAARKIDYEYIGFARQQAAIRVNAVGVT